MTAVRIIGICMIITSSVLIGVAYGEKARNKIKLLESLMRLVIRLRGEVNYSVPVLSEIFEDISGYTEDIWSEYFLEMSKRISAPDYPENEDIMWGQVAAGLHIDSMLYEEDYNDFIRFGSELDGYDKESLVNRIDMYIGILDNRIATLNKDIGNRVRICRMLGITGGAFLTILIV